MSAQRSRRKEREERSNELLLPFTSRTRNLSFPFEGPSVSFATKDCEYKVRKFTYRRAGHVSLRSRRKSFSSRARFSY